MLNNSIVIEKIKEVRMDILEEVLHKLDILQTIGNTLSSTTLKIYDVSYRLYTRGKELGLSDENVNSLFQLICEDEYRWFEEWENENLSYVKRSYIGRSSSFYYMSDWYGSHIETSYVEDLLEGNNANLKSLLNYMESSVYDATINNVIPTFEDEEEQESFIEQLDDEYDFLIELNSELDTVKEILDEALKAYAYLSKYKTQENEYYIADSYLQHDIEGFLSEEKAEKLFDELMNNISPIKLNNVNRVEVKKIIDNGKYKLQCLINDKSFTLETNINSNDELSESYIDIILDILNELINHNFELEKDVM